jgi:hypothetical protein
MLFVRLCTAISDKITVDKSRFRLIKFFKKHDKLRALES